MQKIVWSTYLLKNSIIVYYLLLNLVFNTLMYDLTFFMLVTSDFIIII